MKKKLALMCLVGMMAFGAGACGGKNDGSGAAEPATETAVGEEGTDETAQTQEKVRDRPGYVGYQDLNIEEYVTLADYKNMKVSVEKSAVDDAGIEQYINSTLLVGNITDRAVRKGDVANIDFVGKKDGVAFEGGTGAGYDLGIGTGSFIPGFEDGLVGVMPGETVDLDLTFPENYPSADLAGQAVVFTVTVNSIKGSAEYATVTEKEMQEMGLSYRTKEEVWEAGRAAVMENSEAVFAENSKAAAIDKLVSESVIKSLPDYLVEEELQNYNNYMTSMAKGMYNMSLEDYVVNSGQTMEQYNAQLVEMCSDRVRQGMVFEAFARAEGIGLTEEDVKRAADSEASEYGMESGDALIEEAGFTVYRMYILNDKVVERLMQVVTVEAKEPPEEK